MCELRIEGDTNVGGLFIFDECGQHGNKPVDGVGVGTSRRHKFIGREREKRAKSHGVSVDDEQSGSHNVIHTCQCIRYG